MQGGVGEKTLGKEVKGRQERNRRVWSANTQRCAITNTGMVENFKVTVGFKEATYQEP